MNLITIDKVSKVLGDKTLFENISLGINEGEKVALFGVNGCGKSTLLKIIASFETCDSGTISKNKVLKVSFLNQVPLFNPQDTILEHIFKSDDPKVKLIKKYEKCSEKLKESPEHNEANKELDELTHLMDSHDAWHYEREISAILDQLAIKDLNQQMNTLSGGMLKKVALAQCLVATNNLLILDEPTNHLDLETITWLEEYLAKDVKTLIMVTHDRYFLDRICDQIIEIEYKKIYQFKGNYTYYLEKKSEIENSIHSENERVEAILRKELIWLKKGVKARGTKQKARIDRIEEMRNRNKIPVGEDFELEVPGRRLGNKILELTSVSKSFNGQIIINDFSYTFKKNERIGIIGPNGSGKTTLLNLITGKIQCDSGKIEQGINTHFGFFDQNSMRLNPNQRVIDFIKQTSEQITLSNGEILSAGKILERFLFTTKEQSFFIEKLSGGERRRLYLLHILMKNPNFLLFDEPTNDLDIKTLSILEDFLENFGGCVILVSHDRYFLDRLAGTLLVFGGNGYVHKFVGNYSDYLEFKAAGIQGTQKAKTAIKKKGIIKKQEKRKLSYLEEREFEGIEREIYALEKEKAEIEEFFNQGKWDDLKTKRYQELENLILQKMERWEYLSIHEE